MIKVYLKRNNQGTIGSVRVTGHANYGEYGQDVVCAGVSALIQMIPLSLVRILNLPIRFIHQPGRMWIRMPHIAGENSQKAAFLLDAVVCTIHEMQRTYEGYIEIVERGRDSHV